MTFLKGVDPKRLTSVAEHVLDVKQLVVIERREQVMEGMVTVHYQGQKQVIIDVVTLGDGV